MGGEDREMDEPGMVSVHMKNQEEKEGREGLTLWENLYYGVIWCAVMGIMIWFVVGIAQQYQSSNSSPSTIITFDTVAETKLPKVTICNWNQINPYPYNVTCDYCDLQLISCVNVEENFADAELMKVQIGTDSEGTFNCYQFNWDLDTALISSQTGYGGSFSALFVVVNPPEDQDLLRIGLQVSLNPVDPNDGDTTPPVFAEDKFAPPGFDSYFAIQTVRTLYLNETGSPSDTRYDATFSTTSLTRKNNDTHSFISVSWAFQTLNIQQIAYDPQYTLNNFFGDFAGMIGTLMGLDVIKLAAGVHVGITAFKTRNIYPLQEHFNG